MKKLTNALKQMLDAMAFEHAGEFMSQREKTEVLGQTSGMVEKAPVHDDAEKLSVSTSRRRVALYLGSELPAEVMTYVVQTCANLHHDLTVLTFEQENMARSLMQPHEAALSAAGIDMKVKQLSGEPISGLARYLKGRPEIAFLACKENGYLGRCYLKGTKGKNIMPVPVVVVATGKGSALSQVPATMEEKADNADIA